MTARESTTKQTQRAPLSACATAIGPPSIRLAALLFVALIALTLLLASRAEAYVYWVNRPPSGTGGTLGRANLDGSRVDQSFITDVNDPCAVAVDDEHVYWDNFGDGTIGRADLEGGGANPDFITGANFPCGVAVDDTHVYWSNGFGNTIGRADVDGSGVDQRFITDAYFPRGVAVDDAHVYWVNSWFSTNLDLGTIGRADLDGSDATRSFITGANLPCGVAVDGAHVYWANLNGGTIGRANLDGTGVEQSFITASADPCGVAVNDTHIYWANQDAGAIGRANLDGTGVQQGFITGASSPFGVAVDPLIGPAPSNAFRFGRAKKNKRRGTAKLTAVVPEPGELELAKTRRVKSAEVNAEAAGKEKLPIRPRGKARRRLNKKGRARVMPRVTYTPEGGEPNTRTRAKPLQLIKRS